MFRKFRIAILLLIFATVSLGAWRANSKLTAWENSVHVAIYPIAADDSSTTRNYLNNLNADSFEEIAQWLQAESHRHGRSVLQPIVLHLASTLNERPPLTPYHPSVLEAIMWSLKLRWWAYRHDAIAGPTPQIRLFIMFHDPESNSSPPHSVGLAKGQIGLIHAYASRLQRRQNNVIIAHELLHIFGATDKYDPATLQPIHPQGYAEPQRSPRWPQVRAEIMGGRTPTDERNSEIPANLGETLIGPETAREIGLMRTAH